MAERSRSIFLICSLLLLLAGCTAAEMPTEVAPKRAPEAGDSCDPTEERLHSVVGDKAAFLICDLEEKIFHLHRCESNDGVMRIFDAKRQQCIAAQEEHLWLLMAPPNSASWKRVGDTCVVNRECWDGMYCTGGICTCYLNYVQINSMCVRVSSTCPGSTYYPEPVDGKPKVCSILEPCPPGYICRPELGGEQGFCCLATAAEVCGSSTAHIVNGRPVSCYDSSATAEACPDGYSCQLYPLANRRYCCKASNQGNSSGNGPESAGTTPALEKGRPPVPMKPDSVYCPVSTTAFLHDGNPVICNPNNESSCPHGTSCIRNDRLGLHFCCDLDGSAPNTVASTTTATPTTEKPEKPWIHTAGGIDINPKGSGSSSTVVPGDVCAPLNRPFLFEGKPVLCIANDSASCPVGYACTMHTPTAYFCCRMSPAPEPNSPLTDIRPVPIPTAPASQTPALSTTSFRPPPVPVPSIESICGPSSKPYLYGGNPVMCLVNETGNCPFGYVCDLHHPSDAYFCCQREMVTTPKALTAPLQPSGNQIVSRSLQSSDGCPEKMIAAKDQNGGTQLCDLLLSPNSCPSDFSCLFSTIYGRYQCCGKVSPAATPEELALAGSAAKLARKYGPANTNECPPGQVPYRDPVANESYACAANHLESCPGGYFCQWSEPAGKFLCCGVSAGCPSRGVAHVSPATGQVQQCGHPLDTSCPPGYTCQRTQNGTFVCCSGGSNTPLAPRLHPTSVETPPKPSTPEPPPVFTTTTMAPPLTQPGKACQVGPPLAETGAADRYKSCSERSLCPPGYQCTPSAIGGVCCLKPEKICVLPEETGTSSCSNSTGATTPGPRFFYDTASESCKQFNYNGCGGNLNNFVSIAECEAFCAMGLCSRGLPVRVNGKAQRCDVGGGQQCPNDYICSPSNYGSISKTICCPSAGLICNLNPLAGQPCHPTANISSVTRYYYHPTLRTCRTFTYFGCNGNANNFETADECRSFCSGSHIEPPPSPVVPGIPVPSATPETSTATTPQFPVPAPTTRLPVSLSEDEFRCPVFGQVLHSDPVFRTCLPAAVFPCPDGFTCQKAVRSSGDVSESFVCCGPPTGSLKSQICPNGTDVYVNPLAKQPAVCNPADAEACPKGFGCVLSKFMRTFYCCATSATPRALLVEPPPPLTGQLLNTMEEVEPECPAGQKPFMYPRTDKPLACIKPTSVCPENYSCTLSTNPTTYLCCSNKDHIEARVHSGSSPRFLPPNPFLQTRVGLPPIGTSFNSRSSWISAKAPSAVGHWVPTADEVHWPHRNAPFENEPLLPYGQVHVLNTDAMQPVSLPLELFLPNRAADMAASDSVRSISCNVSEKKQLGQECCAHEQCLHYCGSYRGRRICVCPRHRLFDLTHNPPKCSSSCSKWRSKGFCLPEKPEPFPPVATEEPRKHSRRRAPARGISRTFSRRRVIRT